MGIECRVGEIIKSTAERGLSASKYLLWLCRAQDFDYQGTTTPANITVYEGEPEDLVA